MATLDGLLAELPPDFVRIDMGEAWFVGGAGGCFVVADARRTDVSVAEVSTTITSTVNRLRSAMVTQLSWAPFVDALALGPALGAVDATVVEADQLATLILDGSCPVAPAELDRIASLASALADARMDRCASLTPPTGAISPSTISPQVSPARNAITTRKRRRSSSPTPTAFTDSSGVQSQAV